MAHPPYRCLADGSLSTPTGGRRYDWRVTHCTRLVAALLVVLLVAPATNAARRGICDAIGTDDDARIGLLSAFPAELAPLIAAADVTETIVIDGRSYYVGTLAGVRVVMAMTGIGLVNAENTTATMLERFTPRAIVFSGVAGTPGNIGDVTVADTWRYTADEKQRAYRANAAFLALARAAAGDPVLEQCTEVEDEGTVCMPHTCSVTVGGEGRSDDPYAGNAFACTPGSGDIFGCEVPGAPAPALAPAATAVAPAAEEPLYPTVVDMETAAVARLAKKEKVPFVAYRGASDGGSDPLGLVGFNQFFAYYRLAANNSALATRAFLTRLAALDAEQPRICKLLHRKRWKQAAKRIAKLAD